MGAVAGSIPPRSIERSSMTVFCVFKELKVRDYSLPDPPFAIRGLIVFLNPEGVSVNALFPPYQLEAPEHKADFSRLLNKEMERLRAASCKVKSVCVHQGGKYAYSIEVEDDV